MSYVGTLEKTVDAAIEQAKADMGTHDAGGFAIIKEQEGGYFYLPIAPGLNLSSTDESKLVSRWEKTGDKWNEMLRERAMGESP